MCPRSNPMERLARRRGAGFLAVAILLVAGVSLAAAEPSEGVRLVYERAPGADSCPSELTVRADVFSLLGADPFEQEAEDWLECTIAPTDDGFMAELRIVGADGIEMGRRTLDASDCDELARSVALALAMVMRAPDEFFTAPPPAKPVPAVELPAPAPVASTVAEPMHERPPLVPFVLAGAGAAIDSQARLGAAAYVGGGVRRRDLSLELGLRLLSSDTAQVTNAGSVSASSGAVVVSPCYHRSQWASCGLVSVGWVRGRGRGLEMSEAAISPHVGIGARIDWSARIRSQMLLRVSVESEAAVTRTRLLVDGTPAWESAAARFGLGLAAVAHFE